MKTGHCLTGQYLKWTKSRAAANCWWCPYRTQTREHLFKNCPHWKAQRKILWAEVWKETGRGESRFKVRDLFVDERCSQAILDFLATTDVGRRISDAVEEDSLSEMSEPEPRERKEKAQERETMQETGNELSAVVDEDGSTTGSEEVLGTDLFRGRPGRRVRGGPQRVAFGLDSGRELVCTSLHDL